MADAAVVAEFNINLAWETEGLRLDPKVVKKGVAAILKNSAKGIYFVAEEPGAGVVGQLMITYEWSDWNNADYWWLQSVYVRKDFRGRGVFSALFEHLEKTARKSKRVCALRLYLAKTNKRARQAYRKMGMKASPYEVMDLVIS